LKRLSLLSHCRIILIAGKSIHRLLTTIVEVLGWEAQGIEDLCRAGRSPRWMQALGGRNPQILLSGLYGQSSRAFNWSKG